MSGHGKEVMRDTLLDGCFQFIIDSVPDNLSEYNIMLNRKMAGRSFEPLSLGTNIYLEPGKGSIRYRERFLIPHKADEYLIVPVSDVSHIAIKDGLVRLCTHSGKVHSLGMTLEDAEAQLDPQRFLRVNRQYIVNTAAVEKLSTWFQGKLRVHLKGYPDEEIIVSKDKTAVVKRWLDT